MCIAVLAQSARVDFQSNREAELFDAINAHCFLGNQGAKNLSPTGL
jgi:hypothetical protein